MKTKDGDNGCSPDTYPLQTHYLDLMHERFLSPRNFLVIENEEMKDISSDVQKKPWWNKIRNFVSV